MKEGVIMNAKSITLKIMEKVQSIFSKQKTLQLEPIRIDTRESIKYKKQL